MGPAMKSIREVLDSLVQRKAGSKNPAEGDLENDYRDAMEKLVHAVRTDMNCRESEHVDDMRHCEKGFRDRNYQRWKSGFDMLAVLRQTSIEAGQMFQAEFLAYREYHHDPLLGVLMHLHAHACRLMGEIEALLIAGYPDGAHARWRTMHEIAVYSILIRKHGQGCAEDFIRYGLIEAANGMEGYQITALAMGREPYSDEVLRAARELRDNLLAQCDPDIQSSNGWARTHVGSSKFLNLQRAAGLDRWANDYKAASRSIHFDYREMRSLLGMAEAKEDMLLCGPSNSGMTGPAHAAAIALVQTTGVFLTGRLEDQDCPLDYSTSLVMVQLLDKMQEDVGQRFLEAEQAIAGGAEGRDTEQAE